MKTRLLKSSENTLDVPILNMPSNGHRCPYSWEQDPISKILGNYRDYPSIELIKARNNFF